MKIIKKVDKDFFEKILSGDKNFEFRLADFQCKVGDILILKEWDPKIKKETGRAIEKKITYILKTKELKFWTKKEIEKYGYQVLSLK